MDKLPLSVLIPTKNETRNIADCLASVAFAGERVVSDKVNIWREIKTDGAGLVGPPNAARFADMIDSVRADSAYAQRLGDAGMASVARRYDWARIGPRLAEVYTRLAKPTAACGEASRAAAHAPSER